MALFFPLWLSACNTIRCGLQGILWSWTSIIFAQLRSWTFRMVTNVLARFMAWGESCRNTRKTFTVEAMVRGYHVYVKNMRYIDASIVTNYRVKWEGNPDWSVQLLVELPRMIQCHRRNGTARPACMCVKLRTHAGNFWICFQICFCMMLVAPIAIVARKNRPHTPPQGYCLSWDCAKRATN